MNIRKIINEEINKIINEVWSGIGMLDPEGLSKEDYELVKQAWGIKDWTSKEFDILINKCGSNICKERIETIKKKKHHDEEYSSDNL